LSDPTALPMLYLTLPTASLAFRQPCRCYHSCRLSFNPSVQPWRRLNVPVLPAALPPLPVEGIKSFGCLEREHGVRVILTGRNRTPAVPIKAMRCNARMALICDEHTGFAVAIGRDHAAERREPCYAGRASTLNIAKCCSHHLAGIALWGREHGPI